MRCSACNSTQIYHREKDGKFKCIKCGGITNGVRDDHDGNEKLQKVRKKV